MSDTHAYVYGFRMLLNFVLSAKSTKYTKLNRIRKFVRLQYSGYHFSCILFANHEDSKTGTCYAYFISHVWTCMWSQSQHGSFLLLGFARYTAQPMQSECALNDLPSIWRNSGRNEHHGSLARSRQSQRVTKNTRALGVIIVGDQRHECLRHGKPARATHRFGSESPSQPPIPRVSRESSTRTWKRQLCHWRVCTLPEKKNKKKRPVSLTRRKSVGASTTSASSTASHKQHTFKGFCHSKRPELEGERKMNLQLRVAGSWKRKRAFFFLAKSRVIWLENWRPRHDMSIFWRAPFLLFPSNEVWI